MVTLKEVLKKELTEEEMKMLPSSFDIVGDIIIFSSIPEELAEKEGIVADGLLKLHKNVKVIAKKIGQYAGIYRTPKLEIIKGEQRKETLHRENNVILKLDVEKVYFSPRLAEERKRIASLIKPNEDVLVMFSGCAPYVLVIARNSSARKVYGIEKNPVAHAYALENVKLNRMKNVELVNGDVRKETSILLKKRAKAEIGMKCSISKRQLKNVLNEKPGILELYLRDRDLSKNMQAVEAVIRRLKKLGVRVMLHQPSEFKGKIVDISTREENISENSIECYKILLKICKRHKNIMGFVMHPCDCWSAAKSDAKIFIENFKKLSENPDFQRYAYVENVFRKIFNNEREIYAIIKEAGIKNMCIDLAHFIVSKKQYSKRVERQLISFISKISGECKLYFHIADSDGRIRIFKEVRKGRKVCRAYKHYEEALPVGKGRIDFKRILPLIREGVIEVPDENPEDAVNEINSFRQIIEVLHQMAAFDRIVMPLPKGAENFLDVAFSAIKKNGTIHFYTFLKKEEIPRKGFEEIERAALKYKKKVHFINWKRCGHYAPGRFRVCIDFQLL